MRSNAVLVRTKIASLLYIVHGISTLLVLNGTPLNSINTRFSADNKVTFRLNNVQWNLVIKRSEI